MRRVSVANLFLLVVTGLLPVAHALGHAGSVGSVRGSAASLDGPAPVPYVIWVEEGPTTTTTPPTPEQCHGCGCMVANLGGFMLHGSILTKYRCNDTSEVAPIPELSWTGPTGGPNSQSTMTYAITIADLDFPNGMGSGTNRVKSMFWVANIPSFWRKINDKVVADAIQAQTGIVVGMNSRGVSGLERLCPQTGQHRYKITLWALRNALPGIDSGTPYQELLPQLESMELAQHTFYARITARSE